MTDAPATILVVDDVPANLGLLFDALTQAGHRVLVAESGEGALAQLAHETPDLILLDYMLPGMDGMEVCRRIKARPASAEVPVLFLTAVSELDEKVRALDAGAVDYVTKPIQTAEVLARVRTHLRIARLQRELAEELEMRREAEEQLRDSLDRALVVAATDGRIHFATRLAQTLLVRHFADTVQGELPSALRTLLAGGTLDRAMPAGLEARLLRAASITEMGVLELTSQDAPHPGRLLALGLTPREAEVLFWLSEGKSNPEIATILGSARRTVEKHVERILEKLGVEHRAGAARVALTAMGFA
ncbi:MAG TPA: response regulator [Candidatus Limnocylindria bacterium]|nr:response regulator [Candidatus Limnocylindria bacterium]